MVFGTVAVTRLVWLGDVVADYLAGSMQRGFIYTGAIVNCVLLTLLLGSDIFRLFKFTLPQYSKSSSDNLSEKPLDQ